MIRKIFVLTILISGIAFSATPAVNQNTEASPVPVIGQEVTGLNLQQLEYKRVENTNENLKNQKIESTNMEIIGDSLKKQKQRITVIQSDSIQLQEEVVEGKRKGFFGSIFSN